MINPLTEATPSEFFAFTEMRIIDDFARMFRDNIYTQLHLKYYKEFLFTSLDDDRGRLVVQMKLLVLEDILNQIGNTRKKLAREAKIEKDA